MEKQTVTTERRLLPWRSYDQMLADNNLPPVGINERINVIMYESYMRGLVQTLLISIPCAVVFFIWWFA